MRCRYIWVGPEFEDFLGLYEKVFFEKEILTQTVHITCYVLPAVKPADIA